MLENVMKGAAWLYPEVQGSNPPERWGHSACFSQDTLYIFGGCRGGVHFSDVMSLDLRKMTWSVLSCTGQQPGTRDSHTAVLQGRKMVVFGGTNGSKKINDVHILDLDTHVWSCPSVKGTPPPPRESHSATVVDGNKVIIFGGTGEGECNYLNDIHILDMERMEWVSPAVKGELPVCRDSHTAVAVKDQLIVYGGDCGDRYLSQVDVFNLKNFTWSKIDTGGSPQPAVRAGHVAVAASSKVYIFGGVGDRAYYNDVWVLDINTWRWSQLEVAGLQPQGRFSHVAVMRDDDIAIYGGCGEDERPLDEVLVLHLGIEQLNPEFPKCRFVQTVCENERHKPSVEVINDDGLWESETKKLKKDFNLNKSSSSWKDDFLKLSNDENEVSREALRARTRKTPFPYMEHLNTLEKDGIHTKRRRTTHLMGVEYEQDEASPTMSKQPSPTLSDQDRTHTKPSRTPIFLQQNIANPNINVKHPHNMVRIPTVQLQFHLPGHQTVSLPVHDSPMLQQQQSSSNDKLHHRNMVGAEVRGIVDGAFDSGYLMTAQLNGQIFRGVLFCPGPTHPAVHRPPVHNKPMPPHVAQINGSYPVNGYPVHFSSATVDSKITVDSKSSNGHRVHGGFPAVVAGQHGRWIFQPSGPSDRPPQQKPTATAAKKFNEAEAVTLSLGQSRVD